MSGSVSNVACGFENHIIETVILKTPTNIKSQYFTTS